MGLFNKLKNKADKSVKEEQGRLQKKNQSAKNEDQAKQDLTLEELKIKSSSQPAAVKALKKDHKTDTKNAYRVLIKPMVTEKGTILAAHNKYIFEVAKSANKIEIKKAIQMVYGVLPVKINIVNLGGKNVRYGKTHGITKDVKKAVVTLKKGESIQVYEGV